MKKTNAKRSVAREDQKIALHYMKTLVDVARESFLILDAKLRIVSANPTFYQSFKVSAEETEHALLYKIGNGQWNVPKLRNLLEEVLPKKKVVKDYEVTHAFETIGERTMLLNAKQIDSVQLIILAIEDVTERKQLENERIRYTESLEEKVNERTKALTKQIKELDLLNKSMVGRELKMVELKNENEDLKKRLNSSNGRNGTRKNGQKRGNGNHKNSRQK